jgi:hypothetical protein
MDDEVTNQQHEVNEVNEVTPEVIVDDEPGDSEDYGFDVDRFNDLVMANNDIMQRLQVGPDPLALLEMRLKSTILMLAGERGLLDVELVVQEWLAEGLVEAEVEMNRQKILEGINQHPSNTVLPMPNLRVQGPV